MNYELSINLVGGEKAEAILQKLSGLSGALGSGGSVFGGSSGGASIIKQTNDQLTKTGQLTGEIKKNVQSIATSAAQGFSGSGWTSTALKLKQAAEDAAKKNPSWAHQSHSSSGGFGSEEFLKRNPHLRELFAGETGGGSAASKFRGVLWGSKTMLQGQFPAMPDWLKSIGKLGPMQGPDLSGDLRRKFFSIKGLKEPGGKELAKVQALPDMSEFTPKGVDKKKVLIGLATALFNPWIGSRILSDEMAKLTGSKAGGVAAGIFGKGGALGFGEIYVGITTLKKAFEGLRLVVMEVAKAYETARQLYAKALTGGMGLQFTAKRGLIAQIMGVSETDVFRFGAQMAYLNPRLEMASKILAQTATPLTQVSWQFKILQADMGALFAKLANDAAPSIMKFTDALIKMMQVASSMHDVAAKLWSVGKWTPTGIVARLATGEFSRAAIYKILGIKDTQAAMPTTASWMKQLPASSWEKMGLIVGGGNQNFAKQTAANTASAVKHLAVIAAAVTGGKSKPGGNWGMSPIQAAP